MLFALDQTRATLCTVRDIRTKYMDGGEHLSAELIHDLAYGTVLLQPHELQHFHNCDECSHAWWRMKQEAKRESAAEADEKSA